MNHEELSYAITAMAVGIDSFERQAGAGKGVLEDEGLIPLYLGAGLVEERKYTSWTEVASDLDRLRGLVLGLDDGPRRDFLIKLMESLTVAVSMFQGVAFGYQEKLTRLVGVPAEPIDAVFIASLENRLREDLSRRGFGTGSLRDRILAWEAATDIPADQLGQTFAELQREAKARTDRMIVPTGDYTMELNPVRGVSYTARCDHAHRKMDLNVGNHFTRTSLKHLVTHEIFPGHATQNLYTLDAFKRGLATADVLLCSLNGITGVLQEGIADQGVEMIDWIEDREDEINVNLVRYRSAVATQAAWMLNVEKADKDRVCHYMREVGAMQEARIQGRLMMASHPYRAPFIASYFYGNEAVRRVRRAIEKAPERREAFIKDLYGNMHSPESLCRSTGVEYRSFGD